MKKYVLILFLLSSCSSNSPTSSKSQKNKKIKPINSCVCMEIYRPVCGKDGNTYANSCVADCQNIKSVEGACN